MLQYSASKTMLVDYITREHQGDLNLHVSEGQCAYLQLHDGREGFIRPGNHTIRMNTNDHFFRHERIQMYWFNLSNHIDLHLSDTVSVMEQLLKTVDPELRLYAPVDVHVMTDLSVRISDPEKLLRILFDRQEHDFKPVLDCRWLAAFLEKKLHYILEDSLNHCKQQLSLGISRISELAEALEVSMIGDICDLLEAFSLELVAAHVTRIAPTSNGIHAFREKETETLSWYNQVQMDHFLKGSRRTKKRSEHNMLSTPLVSHNHTTDNDYIPNDLQAFLARVS